MRLQKQGSSMSVLTEGHQETGSLLSKNARKSVRNYSDSQQRELKIYVAGLPYKATREDIFFYFQEFGEIISLDITYVPGVESYSSNGERDSNYRNPSRYCILEVRDQLAFEGILNYSPHRLFGRNLYCTEYKQGSKLMKEIRLKNQRRVLLKGVPLQYKMGHIKKIIEDSVGQIEAIYDFRDDIKPAEPYFEQRVVDMMKLPINNPAITIDGRLLQGHEYRNYTVLFFNKVHALQLLTMGRLMVDRNVFATVEPFKPRLTNQESTRSEKKSKVGSKKGKDPFEAEFEDVNDPDHEFALHLAEVGSSVSFVNNDQQNNQLDENTSMGRVYNQQSRGISSTTNNLPAYSKFCRTTTRKTNWSLFEMPSWKNQGLKLHEIPEVEPVAASFEELNTKPTSKQYFFRRSSRNESAKPASLNNMPEIENEGSNIRFNICRNPWINVSGFEAF
jgi:hypothetical protein